MLILNSASCTLKKDLPVNITIEGKEYQRSFIGELYPLDTGFPDADDKEGIRKAVDSKMPFRIIKMRKISNSFVCWVIFTTRTINRY